MGLNFSRLLRNQENFEEALDEGHRFDCSDSEAVRPRRKKVGPSSLYRGFKRLDILQCLLHRRQWHADRILDSITAVTLMTDSSPTTGLEFQGMIAVIKRRDGSY